MRFSAVSALCFLLSSQFARSNSMDATIDCPSASPPYRLIKGSVSGITVEDTEWEIISISNPAVTVDVQELDAKGSAIVWTAPPGQYRMTSWVVSDGRLHRAMRLVSVREDAFPSPPSPPPAPNPAPPGPPSPAPLPPPSPNPPSPPSPSKYGFTEIVEASAVANSLTIDQRMQLAAMMKDVGQSGIDGKFASVGDFMSAHATKLHAIPGWDLFAKKIMDSIQPRIVELWKVPSNRDPKILGEWWVECAGGLQ